MGSFIFDYQAKAAFCLKRAWPFPVPRAFAPDLHGICHLRDKPHQTTHLLLETTLGPKVRLPARGGSSALPGPLPAHRGPVAWRWWQGESAGAWGRGDSLPP